jgi:hypothetical protein
MLVDIFTKWQVLNTPNQVKEDPLNSNFDIARAKSCSHFSVRAHDEAMPPSWINSYPEN